MNINKIHKYDLFLSIPILNFEAVILVDNDQWLMKYDSQKYCLMKA